MINPIKLTNAINKEKTTKYTVQILDSFDFFIPIKKWLIRPGIAD